MPDVDAYMAQYGNHHPQKPVAPDVDIDAAAVASMKAKAHGLDQWEATMLYLPEEAWRRLAQTLMTIESTGTWPPSLRQWRMCCIPKEGSYDKITDILKTRPISIGPIVYRAWAKTRFQQAARALSPDILAALQFAGLPGHDAETIIMSLDQEATCHTHKYGLLSRAEAELLKMPRQVQALCPGLDRRLRRTVLTGIGAAVERRTARRVPKQLLWLQFLIP